MKQANGISFTRHLAYIGAAILIASAGFYADIYFQKLNSDQVNLAATHSIQTLVQR